MELGLSVALDTCFWQWSLHIYVLMQERPNSIANALELDLSCTNPSIYDVPFVYIESDQYPTSVFVVLFVYCPILEHISLTWLAINMNMDRIDIN